MDEKDIDKGLEFLENCSLDVLMTLFSLKIWGSENPTAEINTALDFLTNVKAKIEALTKDKEILSRYSARHFIELFEAKLWEEEKPLTELDIAIDKLLNFKGAHQKRLEELENEHRTN